MGIGEKGGGQASIGVTFEGLGARRGTWCDLCGTGLREEWGGSGLGRGGWGVVRVFWQRGGRRMHTCQHLNFVEARGGGQGDGGLTLPFRPKPPCAKQHGQQWGPSPASVGDPPAATLLCTLDSASPTQRAHRDTWVQGRHIFTA